MGESVPLPVWCFEEGASRRLPRPSFEAAPPYFCGDEWIQETPEQSLPTRDSMASARTRPARLLWRLAPAGTVQVCSLQRSLRRTVGSGQWRWHH